MKKTTLGGIVVCLTLLFAASAVAPAQADWSMTRGNANHTGAGSGNPILKPTLLWNFTLNCTVGTCSFADGVLYFGSSNGTIYALNASTGTQMWSKTLPDHESFGAPAIDNGLLFISSNVPTPSVTGLLDALRVADGEKLWNLTFKDKYVISPTVNAGHVYVAYSNYLYAFDDHTGKVVWSKYTGELFSTSPAATNSVVYSTGISALSAYNGDRFWGGGSSSDMASIPVLAENIVIGGGLSGGIVALDIATGHKLWNYSAYKMFTSPAVFDGTVFFVSNDGILYAFEAYSGTKLWNYSMEPYTHIYSPTVAGGIVYLRAYFTFGGSHYDLCAFNASSGGKLWSLNMANYEKGHLSDPVVDNGVLYVSLGKSIYAFVDESEAPSIPQATTTADVFCIANVAVGILVAGAVALVIFMLYWKTRKQKDEKSGV